MLNPTIICLGDLVRAVQDAAANDTEVLATMTHLLATGSVVLRDGFRTIGCRRTVMAMHAATPARAPHRTGRWA